MNTHLYSFPCEKEWDDGVFFHFGTFNLLRVTFYMKENQLDRGDVDDSSHGRLFIIHGPAGRLRSYLSWWSVQSLSKDLTLSYIKGHQTMYIPKQKGKKKKHKHTDCISTFVSVVPLDIFKETPGHFQSCLWRQNRIEPDCCCLYSPRCRFKECRTMTNKCPWTSCVFEKKSGFCSHVCGKQKKTSPNLFLTLSKWLLCLNPTWT